MTEPTRVAEPWLALPIPAGIPATVTQAAQEAARQVIGCWTLTSTLPGPSLPPVMHEVYEAARAVERAAGWDFSALQNPELVRENLLGRVADLLAGVLGIDVLVEERLAVVDARAELDAEFDQHADTLGGAA